MVVTKIPQCMGNRFAVKKLDKTFGDLSIHQQGAVLLMEICRPPNNFFDTQLISDIADAMEWADTLPEVRALVLASQGRHFCAGADFSSAERNSAQADERERLNPLYAQTVRLFQTRKPVIAAVQGAAVGGGFGLSMACDFRVASAQARFVGNFAKLGIHQGFGLTVTLPRVIGIQKASLMLMTARRIAGQEAEKLGLIDVYTADQDPRDQAIKLATEIADNAPLALETVRASMRPNLSAQIQGAVEQEFMEQRWLMMTEDHKDGVKAVAERRSGSFHRR